MTTKLLIFGLLTGMITTTVTAQNTEGVITYEARINLHRNLPPEKEDRKHMIPEHRTSLYQLIFNASESLYKPIAEIPEPEAGNDEGMRIRMQHPKSEIYTHPAARKRITLQEFTGKKYLIEDSVHIHAWKIGTEMKDINGYPCRQATFTDKRRKMKVVAWYTDRLLPFLGPENFNTLPGAVLHVDINDGQRVITAKDVTFRPLEKNELKIPNAKNKVTRAAYREIVKTRTARMRTNGGNRIIRD